MKRLDFGEGTSRRYAFVVMVQTTAFRRDLSVLLERGQRLTLRKSQAMKLLLDRGYSVSLDALKPTDE